jgi:pimeloyl-ACP methyl ester carboxylesterase
MPAWFALLWLTVSTGATQPGASSWLASTAPGGPVLVVLPGSRDVVQDTFDRWKPVVAQAGWTLAVWRGSVACSDATVSALEQALGPLITEAKADPQPVYLVGEGAGGSAVFYLVSRRPDLWAAAAALGGNPRTAIETNRLFAANTTLAPVLWLPRRDDPLAEPVANRLREAGYRLVQPPKGEMTLADLLGWLGTHRKETFPNKIDCETGHPGFARCYWAEISRLDFSRRNDALPSSRVPPGSGASPALGGFGFDPGAPGPGVLVGWLPDNYKGPLRLGDRIVAVAGREIADGRAYVEFMERQTEERNTAVMVLRDGRRMRIETRIVLPKREEAQTARLQAEYLPETQEIFVVTRGTAAVRLNVPSFRAPARINWNGLDAGVAERAGCWEIEAGQPARPCPR